MHSADRDRYEWSLRTRSLLLGERTLVMGVVNVTPDSFSDGGTFLRTQDAVNHALRLMDDGADVIDVGGESTRPGASAGTRDAIDAEEEQRRVLPVITELLRARPDAVVSVDTYRASTARLAVEAGAEIVNDVSGMLWDGAMAATCAELRCGVVAMHTRGLPSEWATQSRLAEAEVVPTVLHGLQEILLRLEAAGVERSRVVLDPGFGFGKRGEENWTLLRGVDQICTLGYPVLIGLSRKGFLTDAAGAMGDRDEATAAANTTAVLAGAHAVRVHDAKRTRAAVDAVDALRAGR